MTVQIELESGLSNRSLTEGLARRFVREVAQACTAAEKKVKQVACQARKPTSSRNHLKRMEVYKRLYKDLLVEQQTFKMRGRAGKIFIRLHSEDGKTIELISESYLERCSLDGKRERLGIKLHTHFVAAMIRRLGIRTLNGLRDLIGPYVSLLIDLTMAGGNAEGAMGRYTCIVPGKGYLVFNLNPEDIVGADLELVFVTCITESLYHQEQIDAVEFLRDRSPEASYFIWKGCRLPTENELRTEVEFEKALGDNGFQVVRELVTFDPRSLLHFGPEASMLPLRERQCPKPMASLKEGVIKEIYLQDEAIAA